MMACASRDGVPKSCSQRLIYKGHLVLEPWAIASFDRSDYLNASVRRGPSLTRRRQPSCCMNSSPSFNPCVARSGTAALAHRLLILNVARDNHAYNGMR